MSSSKTPSRGLGRGLSALMSDVNEPIRDSAGTTAGVGRTAPTDKIYPNPDQPRRTFDEKALEDLAASIAEKGVIQPLIVRARESSKGKFEIVAGERRWRAAQRARLHEVPIIIREFDDVEVLEVAIIENIQRADLNPVDEAAGYKQLMDKFGRTQEEMGKALGKSRSHIANSVRLLTLPSTVQDLLATGQISAGHARALVGHPEAHSLAAMIAKKGLSVRDAERLAKQEKQDSPRRAAPVVTKDADTVQIEKDLAAQLGLKVAINHTAGKESGSIVLQYKDLEQLDDLLRILSAG